MTALEVARVVKAEKQCHLVRERDGEPLQYDVKPYGTGRSGGWTAIDVFTASAILVIHDELSTENQKKLAAMPIEKMARVAMGLV